LRPDFDSDEGSVGRIRRAGSQLAAYRARHAARRNPPTAAGHVGYGPPDPPYDGASAVAACRTIL